MASQATKGYGSQLYFNPSAAAPANFTKIAQSVDLKGPKPESGKINITNNDSPSNSKEYLPGMFEPGDVDFKIIHTPAQGAALDALRQSQQIVWWAMIFPDGSGWKWTGWVASVEDEGKTEDGVIEGSVMIHCSTAAIFMAALS